jgi:hypothetical protein
MPDPISGLMAAASVGSGIANIFGAQSAADAQKAAADKAAAATLEQQQKGLAAQKDYFNQGTAALKPIADAGSGVYNDLVKQLPDLTAPITMDQATLEATPGYQFNLKQGIRGVDLSAVTKGMSGAQAKAAAAFATGLADNTYQNQFNNANTNKTNAFNRLLQTATVGTDAAKSMAGNATSAGNAALGNSATVGNSLGNYAVGAGDAQAAADNKIGAQAGNIINGVAAPFNTNRLVGNMYGGGGGVASTMNVGGNSYPAYT